MSLLGSNSNCLCQALVQVTSRRISQLMVSNEFIIPKTLPSEQEVLNTIELSENIRQERDKSLQCYIDRFHRELYKVAHTPEEFVRTLIIAGVRWQTDLWKELQFEDDVSSLASITSPKNTSKLKILWPLLIATTRPLEQCSQSGGQ